MGIGALIGAILSFAIGVVQLLAGDWSGALWTIGGVALLYARRHWL
ncbi:hypothetical protein [Deinococcus sp.]